MLPFFSKFRKAALATPMETVETGEPPQPVADAIIGIIGDILHGAGEKPMGTSADVDQLAELFDWYTDACRCLQDGSDYETQKQLRQLGQELLQSFKQRHEEIKAELDRRSLQPVTNEAEALAQRESQRSYAKLLPAYGRLKQELRFVDLRGATNDPAEALYRSAGHPVLIDVSLEKLRNLCPLAFPTTSDSGDPYVMTVREYLNGRCESYKESWLEWFFTRWTPCNAAAVLGLEDEEAPAPLAESPPYAFVYPWTTENPRLKEQRQLESMRNENIKKGRDIAGTEGYVYFGPLSNRKGELEFARLCRIADSVLKNGYQTAKTNINGELMVRGNDWRIGRGGGNHRRAVLTALGWSHAPVRLKCKIDRDDVASWPNVRSGLFTQSQALRLFDRIFEGRQPPGCPSAQDAKEAAAARPAHGDRQ